MKFSCMNYPRLNSHEGCKPNVWQTENDRMWVGCVFTGDERIVCLPSSM